MGADFEIEKGVLFGEWLHEQMHKDVHFEEAQWALERVRRVESRLQEGRPPSKRLYVEIPWLEVVTAFTAPGRYIYFSRRLFERCSNEEHVAIVVAHEMAHHDLEHVNLFAGWSSKIISLPGADLFAFAFHAFERVLYGPEKECDADRHGLDLCLAAGYDGHRCLELFDTLEQRALDMGDYDMVYGPDEESDDELADDASWKTKAQIWLWQRTRGYLPIRDRKQMLLNHLETKKRGKQSSNCRKQCNEGTP